MSAVTSVDDARSAIAGLLPSGAGQSKSSQGVFDGSGTSGAEQSAGAASTASATTSAPNAAALVGADTMGMVVRHLQSAGSSSDTHRGSAAGETTAGGGEAIGQQSARDAFLEFMNMSWEERYFSLLLAQKGLTKEEFEALPPEEKQEILEEIEQEIKDETEQKMEGRETEGSGSTEDFAATAVSFDEVASSFDLSRLSPHEVDDLARKLGDTGTVPIEDIMGMLMQGDSVRGTQSDDGGDAIGEEKVDLVA